MGSCISKQKRTAKADGESSAKDEIKQQQQQTSSLNLAQFELRRVIGRGTFGKVKVVVHKSSGQTYALKYISKAACVARQAAVNVIRERKIMEVLRHALVCNLRYAFQDVEYLYLVSDLMLGGDLRFHILRKTFTEDAIRIWIAETVAALSYCHSRGIIHRDVKPDNILLTADGHCKLADFNISTQIRGPNLPRTRSGSLFYMAPEIHEGLPYDYAVDYWSLGIVFFEAIYGHRPFHGKNSKDVLASIHHCEAPLPSCTPPVSSACEDAIRALLKADPGTRHHTQADIASLPFFTGLNWTLVNQGQATPVFVPGSDKNFDAAWELEEILLHDSPLEPRRQANKKKPVPETKAAADLYELMDLHFTDFDYTTAPHHSYDEKISILQHPSNLISDAALSSGAPEMAKDGLIVDADERRLAAGAPKDAPSEIAGRATGKDRGFLKSKPKKPVILPPGVLSLKAGGRVKVATTLTST